LQELGLNPSLLKEGSLGMVYEELLRQANMLAFNDAFAVLSTMLMLTLPLVLLIKKETHRM
jgi:DHA2 family multidrug resistance protein